MEDEASAVNAGTHDLVAELVGDLRPVHLLPRLRRVALHVVAAAAASVAVVLAVGAWTGL